MSTYRTGTVTVNNGSSTATGSGTAWVAAGVREGDFLFVNGLFGEIASVQSNTSLTLVRGWPGANASGQQYSIALIDDGQRSIASLNQVLQSLGAGTLTSLAALSAVANEMPYWTGAGVMGKTALTSQARTLLGATLLSRSGNNYVFDSAARITGGAVTLSANDTESGRLLKVGDFGLGATTLGTVLSLTQGNEALPNGFYGGSGSNAESETFPSNSSRFRPFLNMNRRISSDLYSSVRMFFNAGTIPVFWERDGNGVWDAPFVTYGNTNILGTVSQSSGVPSGGIIQRGSNANGEFVRFADGTQISWVRNFSVSETDASWFFPSSFSDIPSFLISAVGTTARVASRGAASSSNVTPRLFNLSGDRVSSLADLFATGRWF